MTKPELNLCPFCGGEVRRDDSKSKSVEGVIWCDRCSFGAFISDWNNRPIEDSLQAEIDRLRHLHKGIAMAVRKLSEKGALQWADTFNMGISVAHGTILNLIDEQALKEATGPLEDASGPVAGSLSEFMDREGRN